jgi:LysM repeat protein
MSRKILIFLVALALVPWVAADEVQLRPDHPGTYTVQQGDTLWDIAGRFLTQPWQWPQIWEVNPQIANPHLIYPGDVLALTYKDGRPLLSVANRNIKLSPTIRETRHDDAIRALPLDAVQQFLSRPRVVSESEIQQAAYIVGSKDEHLAFGSGNRVYVRGLGEPTTNKFSIFRPGGPYRDPDTQEILGYAAEHVGDAILERVGDPATIFIVNAGKEVLKGDRLMPQSKDEIPEFIPHAPGGPVAGKIISVVDGLSQVSLHQVVVLNRGGTDGLEPGHVLAIYQDGEVIEDRIASDVADRQAQEAQARAETENPSAAGRVWEGIVNDVRYTDRLLRDFVGTPIQGSNSIKVKLPEERAGELMVFRTFDRVSYGLVMNIQGPVQVFDNIRNP